MHLPKADVSGTDRKGVSDCRKWLLNEDNERVLAGGARRSCKEPFFLTERIVQEKEGEEEEEEEEEALRVDKQDEEVDAPADASERLSIANPHHTTLRAQVS